MLQHFFGFVYLSAVSQLVSLTDTQAECPVQLSQKSVVVEYGGSVAVNCTATVQHDGMGWEADEGRVEKTSASVITWSVSNLREWEIRPFCYINYLKTPNTPPCQVQLPVTVYKTPDSVSISFVNHSGPMIEGKQYELQCDVQDVAPVQSLIVKWYKGQTLLDQTTFTDTIKTPVNEVATLQITADRADDGAQYRCEAELDLGEGGPQPPPKVTSKPLRVEVHYKPKHSSSTETIIKNDKVMLDCTVKANPTPTYTWDSEHLKEKSSSSKRPSSTLSPGNYTCTATNSLGSEIKVFILKSTGTQAECPVQLSQKSVVVEYGGSVAVNCTATVPHDGMGWEADKAWVEKTNASVITWSVSNLTEWEIRPYCYINYIKTPNTPPCDAQLPVTVYKTPDSVSISFVNHRGPMIEGKQYELQCDVQDVAPVQSLIVKWYKGQTLLDQTTYTDTIKTPVNEVATLLIRPDRADDGAQYRCEAELDLGAEGPQPPPKVTSEPLSVEVHYKPKHSSSTETIIKNDKVMLDCTVKANPAPTYTWHSEHLKEKSSSSKRPSSTLSPGKYTCTAKNSLGSEIKVFILKSTAECPVQFSQKSVVVEYGGSVAVNCTATVPHDGMGWEADKAWVEKTSAKWEIRPYCYINVKLPNTPPCEVELPVTVYKTPDSVSISFVNHSGPMIEGKQYELQCDVQDVAPVQSLTVKWYKGQTRADDGAQYRCEAELDLGAEGPQPPPTVTSEPLNAEVHYKPKHSSSTETIIKNDEVMLDCTVKANPAPTYTWHSEHLKEKSSSSKLLSSTLSPGKYTCTATNSLGSEIKVFILKSTAECPVQLSQKSVVVEYGGSVAVNCTATVSHDGMGWEADEGRVEKTSASVITWSVSNLREWEIQPFCYINYLKTPNTSPCQVQLSVTVYKMPDSVSISFMNHNGPMIEGKQYELQCDVYNVAPVQSLTVKWYKGQTLLDQTTFTDTIKTPVNETATLQITADRADDGAQYRCEAELDLGAEGPQTPPKVTSEPFNAEVHYKPKHSNSTETIIKNDKVMLDCTVKANPTPTYTWDSEHLKEKISSSKRPSSTLSPGKYTCTATNSLGKDSKVFIVKSTGCHPTFWNVLIFFQLVGLMVVI
ncbi:hypothetical protein Q8A67_001021 [Cirrhinus molitorella]|uniref:Ig-like domain-containing protein n=1 Tax=Cirrhinus molitorella TaxID=172907 RepID=A0AA88Q8I6_9TELE|nr:hypothetical protein Q8A67_001021 [Cirrhinus molitorella]